MPLSNLPSSKTMTTSDTDRGVKLETNSIAAAANPPVSEHLFTLVNLYHILDQGSPCATAKPAWGDIAVLQVYYERLLTEHSALQEENQEKEREIQRQQLASERQRSEHESAIEVLQQEVQDMKEEISLMQTLQKQELLSQAVLDASVQKARNQHEARISELEFAYLEMEEKLECAYKEIEDRKGERNNILQEYRAYVTDAEQEIVEFRAELEAAYNTMDEEREKSSLVLQECTEAFESKDILNKTWQSQHSKLWEEHQSIRLEKEAAENAALQRKSELELSHKSSEERAIQYESEKVGLQDQLKRAEDGKLKLAEDLTKTQADLSMARATIATREKEKETARIQSERHASDLSQQISDLKKANATLIQQQKSDKISREGLERRLESYEAWDAQSPSRLLKSDPLKSRRR